jgi:hypothetical protein
VRRAHREHAMHHFEERAVGRQPILDQEDRVHNVLDPGVGTGAVVAGEGMQLFRELLSPVVTIQVALRELVRADRSRGMILVWLGWRSCRVMS